MLIDLTAGSMFLYTRFPDYSKMFIGGLNWETTDGGSNTLMPSIADWR